MVDRESHLKPVLVQPAFPPCEHGRVVHQHVEAVEPLQIFVRRLSNLRLRSQVGDQQVERPVAAAPLYFVHGRAAAGFVAAQQHDARPLSREADRRGLADSGVGAGDQTGLALHGAATRLLAPRRRRIPVRSRR